MRPTRKRERRTMTEADVRANYADTIRRRVAYDQKQMAEWAAKFEQDPLYSLQWAERVYDIAGEYKVASVVGSLLNDGRSLDEVAMYAMDEVVRGARSPSHSTSPCANLAKECETKAWAGIVDELRRGF